MSEPEVSKPPLAALFAHRDYRHLFTAQLAALFGTGLTTVALGLLAYQLAGARSAAVLATALTIKMVIYVTVAPVAAAWADRVPRRLLLVSLDVVRAATVAALPFVDQIWQIYVLIAVLQSASATFTPTFQAVLPDILPDERDYTRALSASQLASTMESLLSPLLAAALLSLISFHWMFLGTAVGFAASAALVLSTRIPNAVRSGDSRVWARTMTGLRTFAATPRLRGLMGLNLTVAAVGAVVMVDTVTYVRDAVGGSQVDVAILLAANGFGTMIVALLLPRILDTRGERPMMLAGATTLLVAIAAAIALSRIGTDGPRRPVTLAVWALIGIGTAMILTPTGRVLRRSTAPADRAPIFAAQFSLSHLCWLLAYPIAGVLTTTTGYTVTWSVLAGLAATGALVAVRCWPAHDPEVVEHTHTADVDPGHIHDAVAVPGGYRHAHTYVIDSSHRRWAGELVSH